MTLRYVSVCSGIEAATVAWHPLGWKPLLFAEIAKFPSAVLKHHYPSVPNVGDFTQIPARSDCDLLVGGTPCQAFSIAGLRGGLSDVRGNLALEYLRLADRLRPRWLLWENVPGVLSSNGGRDFGSILGALGELGYGYSWRVLDAQYIGVPQRRRRVFLVGYLGDWRRAAAVLSERTSMRRDTPKSRKKGDQIAGPLGAGSDGGGFGGDLDRCGAFIPVETDRIVPTLSASGAGTSRVGGQKPEADFYVTERRVVGVRGSVAHTLRAEGCDASEDGTGRGTPVIALSVALRGREGGATAELGGPIAGTLRASQGGGDKGRVIAFAQNSRDEVRMMDVAPALSTGGGKPGQGYPAICFSSKDHGGDAGPLAPTLRSGNHHGSHENGGAPPAVAFHMTQDPISGPVSPALSARATVAGHRVGDLAVTCHAAKGGDPTTDNYTVDGYRVRRLTPRECERLQGFPDDYTLIPGAADTGRYHALGNSMAVPVMRWIGERIQAVDEIP